MDLGADLEPLIGNWLHDVALPGFVPSPVIVERLADDERGDPRYQTRMHVFNGESTPGLLRLRYVLGKEGSDSRSDQTEPVRLGGHEAMEIGVVTSMPPRELWLEPYLSLNRDGMRMTLPQVDQQQLVRAAPFVGGRKSDWRPPASDDIVVDDLDPGFKVEADQSTSGVRLGAGGPFSGFIAQPELDQGLPEFAPAGTASPGAVEPDGRTPGLGQGTGERLLRLRPVLERGEPRSPPICRMRDAGASRTIFRPGRFPRSAPTI